MMWGRKKLQFRRIKFCFRPPVLKVINWHLKRGYKLYFRIGILNGLLVQTTAKNLNSRLLIHRDIFAVLREICNFSFYFYRYSLLAINFIFNWLDWYSVAEPCHFETVPISVPTSYFPSYGSGSGSFHNFLESYKINISLTQISV
jgi:hypothetical protein